MSEKHILNIIIDKIEAQNPLHAKKLKETLSQMDEAFFAWADQFLVKYQQFLVNSEVSLDKAISFYLTKVHENVFEMIHFSQTGKYRYSSFQEVNMRVYSNPEVMNSYLYGLLLSQVLWKQHYLIFRFFIENLSQYKIIQNYLEIGGGHGLFIDAATKHFGQSISYNCLDISDTSLMVAKKFIDYKRVDFIHSDIFNYNPRNQFDFISMGEVLEHVETPDRLLKKLHSILKDDGTLFITVPTNAPDIDHIFLFNHTAEIRDLITTPLFTIVQETEVPTENMPIEEAHQRKICVMYAAFLKK